MYATDMPEDTTPQDMTPQTPVVPEGVVELLLNDEETEPIDDEG